MFVKELFFEEYLMISVVFFEDKGLKRSQQMFSDLNKNSVKPTKSLNILYDHRDEFAKFIVAISHELEIFSGRVELEKPAISNRSTKFFTLNGIADELFEMRKANENVEFYLKNIAGSLDFISQYLYDVTWLMKKEQEKETNERSN